MSTIADFLPTEFNKKQPTESVLMDKYTSPERPMSQRELQGLQNKLYWNLGISKYQRAEHRKCGHMYLVKRGGVKSRMIHKNADNDVGNCSVCWKLRQMQGELYNKARDFIQLYIEEFSEENPRLSFYNTEVERIYYSWLYEEGDE